MRRRLENCGIRSINNIVDITNYILLEWGQPLHAFDADKIKGNKVIVKTLAENTPFTTLDEVERKLNDKDLMICNSEEPMCIAGVFGGIESGISETTNSIFLESACFDAVYVRKTARRHGLNTDASFRFERGTDPNITIYALKRAALLIREIAGGKVSSDIIDIYPQPIEDFEVEVKYSNIDRLLGKKLGKEIIKNILTSLEIKIAKEEDNTLLLKVPPYRVDVKREADIVEEILRIYGFNNIEITPQVNSILSYAPKPDEYKLRNKIADLLSANGFNEIMNNSLTKSSYYEDMESFNGDHTVNIFNPLSSDLNGMRQSLLFGGLETIAYNVNRKNTNIKVYEFGKSYLHIVNEENENPVKNYSEHEKLALFICGNKESENWNLKEEPTNFFYLKSYCELILKRLGFDLDKMKIKEIESDIFTEGLSYSVKKTEIVTFGLVNPKQLKKADVSVPVFYADFNWENILKEFTKNKVSFTEIPKYPSVRRDLALLVDSTVKFSEIKDIARNCEKNLLKSVSIFDVYQDASLGENKKSYAVSFILQDEEKTLTDKQIDKIMSKMIKSYEKQLDAKIR